MRDIVQRECRRSADGFEERLTGTLDEFAIRERRLTSDGAPSHLWHLFDYWREMGNGRPVWERRFTSEQELPREIAGLVSYVETRHDDPLRFTMFSHQQTLVSTLGSNLSGRALMELPRAHAIYCAGEYQRCREYGLPFYHEIDHEILGVRRNYLRLMVPLADLDGRIVRIAYAFRRLLDANGSRVEFAAHAGDELGTA